MKMEIENNKWCGCMNNPSIKSDCSWKIIILGYECCPNDCEIVYMDKLGNWSINNNH